MVLANLIDSYNRRARLYPALLVVFPIVLGGASWSGLDYELAGTVGAILVTLGGASFLAQLARDSGKAKEPMLFEAWGGKPSTQALSYSSGKTDALTLQRVHRKINRHEPGLLFPASAEEEAVDIDRYTASYESANNLLVSETRDKGQFNLLFEENMNYGYRRNLWGMKPAGIATSVLGLVIAGGRIATLYVQDQEHSTLAIIAAIVSCFLLVLWIARITPSWVRVAADSYALQLVSTVDQLHLPEPVKD